MKYFNKTYFIRKENEKTRTFLAIEVYQQNIKIRSGYITFLGILDSYFYNINLKFIL